MNDKRWTGNTLLGMAGVLFLCALLILGVQRWGAGGGPPTTEAAEAPVATPESTATPPESLPTPEEAASSAVAGPQSAALPDATQPGAADNSEPGEALQLADDEVAALDALLAAWATETTWVGTPDPEVEGETLWAPGGAGETLGSGHNVAVYFYDLEAGLQYSYNADAVFYAASLPKAPYAAYLYQLAEQGTCSLDEVFEVGWGQVAGSEEHTGVIKTFELPRSFTLRELIAYMIRESDTVALRVLLARYGAQGFADWAAALGANGDDVRDVLNARICAADAGIYAAELHRYMEEGQHGALLREHMQNTRNRMITAPWPVARKYGWDTAAYHDMAVVAAPHPYLLVILTDKWGGSWAETQMFGTIAQKFEELMAQKRGEPWPADGTAP